MEPFIGQIMMVGFNFAPRGWALCDGQLLPIAQNTALFSLLGTSFGGDGRTTFALPDLRGRVALHVGTGAGLPSIGWGERSGSYSFTLTTNQLPAHSHTGRIKASGNAANTNTPAGHALGLAEAYSDQELTAPLLTAPNTIQTDSTGSGQSINHRPPYLGIYHVIALTGLFPSRN
jgi:microcystin-dependent protein